MLLFMKPLALSMLPIFKVHRPELLAKLKLSHGNDMSTWEAPELSRLQSMMKSAIQQQARQEKFAEY